MAHIGVLEELSAAGIQIQCVAGTSAGAMVGAAFAAGRLTGFRDTMCALTRGRVLRLFDPTWPRTGLLEGRRSLELVRAHLGDRIETLPIPYAVVATDLHSGKRSFCVTAPWSRLSAPASLTLGCSRHNARTGDCPSTAGW